VKLLKINKITYPKPLDQIADIENDSIDVFVELEDGITYVLAFGTPKHLSWFMEENSIDHYTGVPWVIVNKLTEENIKETIEDYAKNDGYWLKLYHMAGIAKMFTIKEMDEKIQSRFQQLKHQ
jgi:hypothetical protein